MMVMTIPTILHLPSLPAILHPPNASSLGNYALITHSPPPKDAPTITLDAPLISLSQDGYSNYYHLLTEILPKFRFLSQLDPSGEALIALPASQLAFVRESVGVFNGREGRGVVWLEEGVKYRSKKGILVIEPSPVFGVVTPEAIAYVRGVVHEALDRCDGVDGDGGSTGGYGTSKGESAEASTDPVASSPSTADPTHPSQSSQPTTQANPTPTKIFFSRSEAKRRILNEHELFSQLFLPTGFTLIHPERMSLLHQARLSRTATIIVAEHGAALTNYLFSSPGCLLVEIFQRREDASFWVMAGVMGREGEWRGVQGVPFEVGEGMRETVVDVDVIRDQLMGMDGIGI